MYLTLDPNYEYEITQLVETPFNVTTFSCRHAYDEYWYFDVMDLQSNSYYPEGRPINLLKGISHLFDMFKITDAQGLRITRTFEREEQSEDECGYVYIIEDGIGNYKIGKSKSSPYGRMDTLQVGNANKLSIRGLIRTPNYSSMERELHRKFATKRLQGEWFQLDFDDLEYLDQLQKGNNGNN